MDWSIVVYMLIVCVAFIVGGIASGSIEEARVKELKKEAVDKGFAFYDTDSKGNATFKWRTATDDRL